MTERRKERFPLWSSLARYFLHGLAFSFLVSLAMIVWLSIGLFFIFDLPFLTIIGIIIGLILSFALMLVILGGLNATLTEHIWHVPINQGWSPVVIHSLLLFLLLFIVGIPSAVTRFLAPSWETSIILFIVYGFVDGYVAKEVAFIWKTNEMQDEGFRGLLTVLKYPGLIAMFAADAIVAVPVFIISLTTTFWWLGLIIFFPLQSPIIYLSVTGIKNERNKMIHPNDGWWTPGKPGKLDAKIPHEALPQESLTKLSTASRIFFHGLTYSLLATLFTFAWVGLTALLVTVGFLIGLVIAFIIDWFAAGGINTMLTEFIWHTEIKHDWKRLLIHGLALNFTLAIASIPLLIMNLYPITISSALTRFIIYCFIYGILARRIAFNLETGKKQPGLPAIPE